MSHLVDGGCVRSKVDRCLVYLFDGQGNDLGEMVIHVDDGLGYIEESAVEWFEGYLSERFKDALPIRKQQSVSACLTLATS